ncbi:MAG: glycosyltransferase family 4 protein [Deltaproteobacteria bacterium]|nr:glycosyltransferase family 4 protein [Deltaproteobacteria bacterium]
MLKVLAILPTGRVFGLQIMTLRLFERLSGKIKSHFLVTRWTDGEFSRRLDELRIPYTYSWLGMFSRKLDWINLYMTMHCLARLPRLYRDFVKLVKSYRPDIIYTANHHELILLTPILSLLDIPVLCHMHDPPPAICFQRGMVRFWGRAVDHYIAISSSVFDRLASLGIEEKKITMLHNGIDLGYFSDHKRGLGDHSAAEKGNDSVVVGMTGQMLENKGHWDFLEAARLVHQDHLNVRFVIGGKPTEPYLSRLRDYTIKHHVDERITFSGWEPDVRRFYSTIDVLVLPSRHEEGFGLVTAEAMAMGLPVIATRSGGAGEVVEDGKTGILVEKQNPQELAEAIRCLVKSPDRRVSMGKAGRQRVEECFDLSKQAAEFEAILESVADSHKER